MFSLNLGRKSYQLGRGKKINNQIAALIVYVIRAAFWKCGASELGGYRWGVKNIREVVPLRELRGARANSSCMRQV